jgi:hypothetical protein
MITLLFVLAVVLSRTCVYRGYAAYGAFAAISLFLWLGRFPGGRLVDTAGTALIALAYPRLDRPVPAASARSPKSSSSRPPPCVAVNRCS